MGGIPVHTTRLTSAIGLASLAILVIYQSDRAFAAGGTAQVATKGEPVYERDHWPKGTKELLELPKRGDGWNGWFSEWPSDVCHYQFNASNTAEVNAIIEQFAKIESETLHIRLSPLSEPRGLDWVTSLDEGNGTAVVFSIGNQQQVNDWYERLPDGQFGVMKFEKTPVAVLPTLTIFVANDAVELSELAIPQKTEVSAGYVPRIFWEWNRTDRPERTPPTDDTPVPAELQQAMDAITDFLKTRQEEAERDSQPR
jgi:hypothetical protein